MKNKEAKSIFSSLENFSSPPPPELWEKIEAQLDKPKKKKRPIIWWSAAACLVAGLSLPVVWYGNYNQDKQQLIIENDSKGVVFQNNSNDIINSNNQKKEVTDKSSADEKRNFIKTKEGSKVLKNKETNVSLTNTAGDAQAITAVPSAAAKDFKNSNREKNNKLIAEAKNKSHSNPGKTDKYAKAVNNSSVPVSAITNFYAKNNSGENAKPIAANTESRAPESKPDKENLENVNPKSVRSKQNVKDSEFNDSRAIAENTTAKDTLSKIKTEVTQLENILAEINKDKSIKNAKPESIDKWSLQVFAGVTGSENFNNEKALGNTVASKQSSGYGVKTNYKLNKKWAVSSGFKINELGQKINGAAYYERGGETSFVSGILTNNAIQLDSPSNTAAIVFVSSNENYLFASNSKTSAGFETGNVTQNLRYFEMPLEVSYALFNKNKTSISMNTGGFVGRLITNQVLLDGNAIGENNNVNQFVYGTLLSSTLQYELYKKTKFFIEPGMNYYINPLENQSFNQFQWMFNVGFNVTF